MGARLIGEIAWVERAMLWVGCLLRRVGALVVYVGRASASEVVLGLAPVSSLTATPCRNPQTSDNECMPFISLVCSNIKSLLGENEYKKVTFKQTPCTSGPPGTRSCR